MNKHQTINKIGFLLLVSSTISLLASCQSPVEEDFGNSVRQVMQAQYLHPELEKNPPTEVVNVSDGQRLEGATEIYRGENSTSERVREDIRVDVGKN